MLVNEGFESGSLSPWVRTTPNRVDVQIKLLISLWLRLDKFMLLVLVFFTMFNYIKSENK
jgi:hypothetical protein